MVFVVVLKKVLLPCHLKALSSASGRRNHGCVTSFFPAQKPALNSHKPWAKRHEKTLSKEQDYSPERLGLLEVFIDQHSRQQQWLSVTQKPPPPFLLQPPHLRSPRPPAHTHTSVVTMTAFSHGPHRAFCLSTSLNSLVIPAAKYPPPNTAFTHTNSRLITSSWHSEKYVGTWDTSHQNHVTHTRKKHQKRPKQTTIIM